jgi:protein-glutamine gamma-glutamyltransferase
MKPIIKPDTRIPRKPFLWLTAALVFTVPAMLGTLATWVPLLFLTALAAKFWMEPRNYRLRSPIWALILGAILLVAVFVSYGSIEGIEPGVSVVIILMSLKILEAHTAREFQVIVNVGWILCLCGFFLSQDLAIALCALVAFILLLVSLIEFHSASVRSGIWRPLRTGIKMLAQAAPLMVFLFVLFPRINIGFRLQLPGANATPSGFSGELAPGSVSSLANSYAVAFRAEFPDGRIPHPENLYWRGVVLDYGNGLDWRRSRPAPAALPRTSRRLPAGPGVRQSITIEPHGNQWMFALDWPGEAPVGATVAPGNYLWSAQPIRSQRKYDVTSYPEIADKVLHPRDRAAYLEVPVTISPAIRQLVRSWFVGAKSPTDITTRALGFFRNERFRYSLNPGEYETVDLDEFLFKRRIGFCEHYAASFATLMRVAGIPSRVVVGYLGGEYNELGRFFVVRQSDSHAWCEVWFPNKGWIRIDPTSVVAPDRLTLGLSGFLERRSTTSDASNSAGIVRTIARSEIFHQVRLAWQAMNYAWDTRILSFDQAAQMSALSTISSLGGSSISILMLVLIGFCVVGAMWFGWIQFRNRGTRDTLKRVYDKFCTKLAYHGARRNLSEGPADFAARAAKLLPDRSEPIREIIAMYVALRYSPQPDSVLKSRFKEEVRAFT